MNLPFRAGPCKARTPLQVNCAGPKALFVSCSNLRDFALNSADRAAVAWAEQTARGVVDLPGTDPGTDAAPIPSNAADTVADGPKRRLAEPWPAAGVPTSPHAMAQTNNGSGCGASASAWI